METIGHRIRLMLKERGITQAELSRRCGMKQQTLSYLCSPESPSGSSRFSLKIAQELGVNPAWLQSGEGDPFDPNVKLEFAATADAAMFTVPYIRCPDVEPFLAGQAIQPISTLKTDVGCGKLTFAVAISDDSMTPVFRAGDHAVVDPELTAMPGDYVVAVSNGTIMLRKYRGRETSFELNALNSDWPTLSSSESIKILGVAIEWRSYRPRR